MNAVLVLLSTKTIFRGMISLCMVNVFNTWFSNEMGRRRGSLWEGGGGFKRAFPRMNCLGKCHLEFEEKIGKKKKIEQNVTYVQNFRD